MPTTGISDTAIGFSVGGKTSSKASISEAVARASATSISRMRGPREARLTPIRARKPPHPAPASTDPHILAASKGASAGANANSSVPTNSSVPATAAVARTWRSSGRDAASMTRSATASVASHKARR